MKRVRTFVYLAAVLFAGCAATVSQQEIAGADYGQYPADYEQTIKNAMSGLLKDPYSAVYRFGMPMKGYARDGIIAGGKSHFGYIIPVGVNAKNSYGGYTGEKMYYFLINSSIGKIWDVTELHELGRAHFVD